MKIFDHHHNQLDKNRNNHSRSNHAEVQSFDHIHERHRHRHSDRDIRDDNHLFNVENDFHSDEQETSLFETHHEDHDLLEKNREARSRSERS
jgi:zona occludens toxin (predicted ATPase)